MAERSSLVRLRREFQLEIEWVGYELHPETPPGGVPVEDVFPDAAGRIEYVRSFAAGFGITDLCQPARLANTRRALAVAQYARRAGRLEAFTAATYDAYWRLGLGIESDAELARLARDARLDPGAAVAAAGDADLLARVDGARRDATRAGVVGIPTLDVEASGQYAARAPVRVVGCQRYEVLAEAVRRAGGRRGAPFGPGR